MSLCADYKRRFKTKLYKMPEITTDGDYQVGERIFFILNDGECVEALAVDQENDGTVFCFVNCLKQEYCMNPQNLNSEILDRFPTEIRKKMVAFDDGDFLRLPTECEIFGRDDFTMNESEDVHQWIPMQDYRNRITFARKDRDFSGWYWLQNRDVLSEELSEKYFYCVNSHGLKCALRPSFESGVRPVFKMKE